MSSSKWVHLQFVNFSWLQIVELKVNMDCEGCEKRIRRAISKLDGKISSVSNLYMLVLWKSERGFTRKDAHVYVYAGVDSLEIEMDKQKVTVRGYVEKRKVLKVVRRTGRKAEFWPFPYDSEYYPYASEYLDESTFTSSYNYYMHGNNESVHGYFPDQAYSTLQDETVALFSDDNVHAYCTIM